MPMAINIRSLLLLPLWCFLLTFSSFSEALLIDSCPYGYRNEKQLTGELLMRDCLANEPTYSQNRIGECRVTRTSQYGTEFGHYYYVSSADCARTPQDDSGENGCYPGNIDPLTGYCTTAQGHQ